MSIFSKMPRLHTFDSWIYYPNYRFLWIGNFSANGAQWLQLLSVGWLVQQLTEGTTASALLVITVGAINTLPSLFVSPWGRLQPYTSSSAEPVGSHSVRGGSTAYLEWEPPSSHAPTSLRIRTPAGDALPSTMGMWIFRIQ